MPRRAPTGPPARPAPPAPPHRVGPLGSVLGSGFRKLREGSPVASIEDRSRTAGAFTKEEGTRGGSRDPVRRGSDRQRSLRHPHRPLRDRPHRQAGRRCRRRLPGRRDDAARRHHGRQAPEGAVRLLPADDRRRGAVVRRRQDPRLVLPSRGSPQHRGHPRVPPDRPPAAPPVRQGPAQRGPGRHHRAVDPPGRLLRHAGHQRRVASRRSSPACRSPARSAACASRSSTASGSRSRGTPSASAPTFDMVVAGRVVG